MTFTTDFPDDPTYLAGGVDVSYTASATPVSIESNFAVRTGDTFNFLVGQQADFYVSAGSYQVVRLGSWGLGSDRIGGVSLTGSGTTTIPDGGTGTYYDERWTDQTINANVDHPSVFYEGNPRTEMITCSVALYDGNTAAVVANLSRQVSIFRPTTCTITGDKAGPCTIFDPDMSSNGDQEWAEARDRSDLQSGYRTNGATTLPSLFTSAQGEGKWSYVHLVNREYQLDQTYTSATRGLDTVYPYGGYVHGTSSSRLEWQWTDNVIYFDFYDAPGIIVGGSNYYFDYFHGDCYAVLRPPVSPGQSYVELPMAVLPWDYTSSSNRSPSGGQQRWDNVGAYRAFGTYGESVTTPSTGLLTPGTLRWPVASYEMDWTHVNG